MAATRHDTQGDLSPAEINWDEETAAAQNPIVHTEKMSLSDIPLVILALYSSGYNTAKYWSTPTVNMARREACATILEDIVLQMQTIMEGDIAIVVGVEAVSGAEATEATDIGEAPAEAPDKVALFVITAVTGDGDGCVRLRSQIIAGKSTKQDTMLIVIRFITNLFDNIFLKTGFL